MKILVWSTAPWVKTGYGKNCKHFITALKEKHQVDVLATYGLHGGIIQVGDSRVFPSNNNFWEMGSWLAYWEKRIKPDLIIQHFDLWVVKPEFIDQCEINTPLVTYMPVDSEPLPHATKNSAVGSTDNIAMSVFAQQAFLKNHMTSSTYIPHTVDTNIFYPTNKKENKIKLGLDPDWFIIGMVATNKGPRKNIPGQLQAFKAFLEKVPHAKLYLHTFMAANSFNPEGFDLYGLIDNLGLNDHVIYTDQEEYYAGVTDDTMRIMYSAFDILSECSFGEGFGIPIIEAQACGTPVVGTNFSAIPEVIGEGGITVDLAEKFVWQRLGVFHAIPKISGITEAYLKIYKNPSKYQDLAIKNAQKYDFLTWKTNWQIYLEEYFGA